MEDVGMQFDMILNSKIEYYSTVSKQHIFGWKLNMKRIHFKIIVIQESNEMSRRFIVESEIAEYNLQLTHSLTLNCVLVC